MDPSQSVLSYSFENSSFELNNTFTVIIPAYNEEKRIKLVPKICTCVMINMEIFYNKTR
jgi:cellulose synthase/poly-beta-1,6-N-acetylglucosamine synthase-like glycosyltransferase